MRNAILFILILTISAFSGRAQIISEFTWNSNPVTTAAIGLNGTSVSAAASSVAGGSTGNDRCFRELLSQSHGRLRIFALR
jgi:hypothetical protein